MTFGEWKEKLRPEPVCLCTELGCPGEMATRCSGVNARRGDTNPGLSHYCRPRWDAVTDRRGLGVCWEKVHFPQPGGQGSLCSVHTWREGPSGCSVLWGRQEARSLQEGAQEGQDHCFEASPWW